MADPTDKQRARDALVVELAIVIADNTARSDVELYAKRLPNEWFDLSDGEPMGKASKADRSRATKKAGVAAAYIDLRASELPYLMLRDPENIHFVRFENRPVGGIDRG